MAQPPPEPNPQQPSGSQNVSQSAGTNEGQMQAVGAGRNATVIQAEQVYINGQLGSDTTDVAGKSKPSARNQRERQQAKSKSKLGKVVSEDHKYGGQLVLIELRFCDDSGVCQTKQIGIGLNIAFGEVEEVVKYRDGSVFGKFREGHIRFGLKHGKLCLALQNGEMPLNQRELHEDSQGDWQVRTTGIKEAPVWEFEARGQPAVLQGSRIDEKLGIVDWSDPSCVVEATFKANINGNDLEITAQDGAWENNATPQAIATKRRLFFKRVVEPKLKEYLSRVVLQYDSAIIP